MAALALVSQLSLRHQVTLDIVVSLKVSEKISDDQAWVIHSFAFNL